MRKVAIGLAVLVGTCGMLGSYACSSKDERAKPLDPVDPGTGGRSAIPTDTGGAAGEASSQGGPILSIASFSEGDVITARDLDIVCRASPSDDSSSVDKSSVKVSLLDEAGEVVDE